MFQISAAKLKKELSVKLLDKICLNFPDVDEGLEQHVIVYNPLAWNITTIINTTLTFPHATVFDDDGQPVPAQVFFSFYTQKLSNTVKIILINSAADSTVGTFKRDL